MGARAALEHADHRAILSGWIAGYCQRVKRFPSFKTLLSKSSTPRQTIEQQARILDAIATIQAIPKG